MGKYFGTDGIRGEVGTPPLTPAMISALAVSAARWIRAGAPGRREVVVGHDTRASSYWIWSVLCGSFSAMGIDTVYLGIDTTPGVAAETRAREAVLGIMITASHNPFTDNGVKLFGHDGFKLSDDIQMQIEAMMDEAGTPSARADQLGHLEEVEEATAYDRQIEALMAPGTLSGMKLVVDAAHGAVAPRVPGVFRRLGADIEWIGADPTGLNINLGVGATHPEAVAARVIETGAYAGVAFDGDADRLIMVDETGQQVDGDQLIGLIATKWHQGGKLRGGGVVTTVMSNLGLERHLGAMGLNLLRTQVGDRNVVAAMREGGFNIGGEQSGHVVMLDRTMTGDGLVAALEVLDIARKDGRPFSQIAHVFEPVPQKLINVRYNGHDPLQADSVQAAISAASQALAGSGRVFVRKSGTEPLIRVMAEANDPGELDKALHEVVNAIRAAT